MQIEPKFFIDALASGLKAFARGIDEVARGLENMAEEDQAPPAADAGAPEPPPAQKPAEPAPARRGRPAKAEKKEKAEKPAKAAPSAGRRSAGRPGADTATFAVLAVINKAERGIDIDDLSQHTGFDKKKVGNIVHRLKKQGKIRSVRQGFYERVQ